MSGSLAAISTAELERLLRRLRDGALTAPLTAAGLGSAGFATASAGSLLALPIKDATGLAAVLECVIAERQRPVPKLELVWTGPEASVSTARKTAEIVADLFAHAEKSVLIAGYRFDHGGAILRPLWRRMHDAGVTAMVFLDLPSDPEDAPVELRAAWAVEDFVHDNWPFGRPLPEIYYAPRLTHGTFASLHAKCIVVDERRALLGSANFTDRGQHRNVEVGVCIEDTNFARQLSGHWLRARSAGLFVPA